MTEFTDPHPEMPVDPDAAPPGPTERPPALHGQALLVGLVAAGGLIGTAVRYGMSLALPTRTGHWPVGTFAVNMAGAVVLGAVLEGLARRGPDVGRRQQARLLVGAGFCGALTTFSTLAVETDLLVRSHDSGMALTYGVGSVIGGLAMTSFGITLAAGRHRSRTQRVAT